MAQAAKNKIPYHSLRRSLDALMIVCFLITVAAGVRAGVGISGIIWRAFAVLVMLSIVSKGVIRCWATWEEISRTNRPR